MAFPNPAAEREIPARSVERLCEARSEGFGLFAFRVQCYPHWQDFPLLSVVDMGAYGHLDIKVDNILVGFEEPSVLEDFAHSQTSNPMPRKSGGGQTVYLSHNDFGPLRSYYILPKLTDFGLAHRQKDPSVLNRHPIQPDHYRAPEVILGAGWTYSADIWNLGVLVNLPASIRSCLNPF